jgi:hypothetical protein
MNGKKSGKDNREKLWKAAAHFYESPESLAVLAEGKPLFGVERRKLLGPGKKKLVAIRMPEDDIESLKEIAKRHNRKYQQLVIQAVELYLDRYQLAVTKKKAV